MMQCNSTILDIGPCLLFLYSSGCCTRYHMRVAKLYTNVSLAGRSPTHATSESPVNVASMAWEGEGKGKYQYHPGGDPNAAPRDAPSALNVVIIPNVTAPKEYHDKFNKWGKEGYP